MVRTAQDGRNASLTQITSVGSANDGRCAVQRLLPSSSITTRFGAPIWFTAPFAIAFSVGFFFGAVTVVSTYDRVSPSHEHELSETQTPDDLRGLRVSFS